MYHGSVTQIAVTSRRLDNGLLVTASRDPLAPGAAVNLWYDVGSADDPPGASGFAHLFEHLMFAGSAHVPDGQHIVMLEALGGLTNATTSSDRTNYFETVPTGALNLALWLEADRLQSLRVSKQALDTQRAVVIEEKRQRYDNQPYGDQLALILALGLPTGHPYATPTIGSLADLQAAQLDDVRAFHDAHYRPSNASLVVVSPLPDDDVFTLADRYLGAVTSPDTPGLPSSQLPALPPLTGVPRQRVTRPVPRSVLHLLWRTPPDTHPDSPAIGVALGILAAGQACRLHRDLVRQRGIAQSVAATDLGLNRGTSLSGITASPASGMALEALEQAVVQHLQTLADDGPTAEEMRRTRAQLEREWFAGLSGIGDRADAINEAAVIWGDAARINDDLDRWLAVTAGDVARAAGTWLDADRRAVLEYVAESEAAS